MRSQSALAGSESKCGARDHTLFDREKTLAQAFVDGTLQGEANPHVVRAWPTFRDTAAPQVFLKPTEYDLPKPPPKRTGIYGGYFDNVRSEFIVFLTIMSPEEMLTDANGKPWPQWYSEHLKVASLKKAERVSQGAMAADQKFTFLLGINTEDGLPKVASCANTPIGEAGEGRRLSAEQQERFNEMWISVYGDA